MNIICENINDEPNNQTRFALIGDYETPVTGNDKTSIAFSTENKSGALLEMLEIFSKYNINLSYIDSLLQKLNLANILSMLILTDIVKRKKFIML